MEERGRLSAGSNVIRNQRRSTKIQHSLVHTYSKSILDRDRVLTVLYLGYIQVLCGYIPSLVLHQMETRLTLPRIDFCVVL